jgi:hypothetical protein
MQFTDAEVLPPPTLRRALAPRARRLVCAAMALATLTACGGAKVQQPSDDDDTVLVTMHIGSYACGNAKWRLTLQVAAFSDGTAQATATQTSEIPPEQLVQWLLKGTLDAKGALKLRHHQNLNAPLGSSTPGFEGTLSDAGFEGTTTDGKCGPVKLPRFAKAAGSPLGE